jgi:hypothetical protein
MNIRVNQRKYEQVLMVFYTSERVLEQLIIVNKECVVSSLNIF